MTNKNVYFFSIRMKKHSNDTYCNEHILKERMEKIIEDNSVIISNSNYPNEEYKSINATEKDDPMHCFIEIVLENETGIFLRFTKQQPRNNYTGRDYTNYQGSSLLSGNDESVNGIEIATYAYVNYEDEIIEVAKVKSAPDEKALAKVFRIYDKEYYIELTAIPNEDSVEELYGAEKPYIRKLEIEVPRPNVEYLYHVLGWDSEKAAEIIKKDDIKLSVLLGPSAKGGYIAEDTEATKGIINAVKGRTQHYDKAVIYGKKMESSSDLRKFNFFEASFGYSINVRESRQENYKTISFSLYEIMMSYNKEMINCYKRNETYFKLFLEERDE